MEELRLTRGQEAVEIEITLNRPSKVELVLHDLTNSRELRFAKDQMLEGRKKFRLTSDQVKKGIYMYTINTNDIQSGYGRLIVE